MVFAAKVKSDVPSATVTEPFASIVVVPATLRFPRVVSEPPSRTVIAPCHVAPSPASIVMSSAMVSALPHSGSDGVMVIGPADVNTPLLQFVRNVERTRS